MNDKWGLIKLDGKKITECIYKSLYVTPDKKHFVVKDVNDNGYLIGLNGKKEVSLGKFNRTLGITEIGDIILGENYCYF